MIPCPADKCSKTFASYKALSGHTPRCKYYSEAIVATAKHFVEPDNGIGPRKRRRVSFSMDAGDEEQDDDGSIDFEVSCSIFIHQSIDSEGASMFKGRRASAAIPPPP